MQGHDAHQSASIAHSSPLCRRQQDMLMKHRVSDRPEALEIFW